MKKMTVCVLGSLLLASFVAFGQTKGGFTRPATEALKALKATRGTRIRSGYVFINGKYLEPPYVVERYGTVLRINGEQITREIVSWVDFARTQEGVKLETMTLNPDGTPKAAAEGGAAGSANSTGTASSATTEEDVLAWDDSSTEQEDVIEEDDLADSLDDLFSDKPAPKKKKAASRRPRRPKAPATMTKVTLTGDFVHNDKSKALLARVNKDRKDVDVKLRTGGYYFFGTRYSPLWGDSGSADHLMGKLPDIMRASTSADNFIERMRAAGFSYLPEALMRELFRNRIDYLKLTKRLREQKESKSWEVLDESNYLF